MSVRQFFFAKKFILPSRAANALQSLTMAYAFAENGVRTTLWPGFRARDHAAFQAGLERDYALQASDSLNLVSLSGAHKGLYGLGFRARLAAAWLTAPRDAVFYARDIKEALMLARLKRLSPVKHPFYFELHELLAEQHKAHGTGREDHFARMEAEVLAQVDGVISISPVLVEALHARYLVDAPVLVSPMGYNHRLYSPGPAADFSGAVTLAYAGSLYEGKGVHNLVRAMAHLPERFRLLVAGGSPESELERLRAMAQDIPGGAERIEFTGFLSPGELGPRLAQCSMMVIPQCSGAEFFSPIKLYEAMGMALPLVATPVPALTSVLDHGEDAIIADDESPEALARAVQDMAGDQPRARAMQQRCRERAATLSWKHRAGQCLEFMATGRR
ncbi:glycosyltransferase [Pseudodesulfovibrio senegalensis]|uniref:Glycosyltransferase family 4 protein n=1 Tax=Pseudodesulfovibrio senegalensis TaxID=1721087 RepID=A0A6N6N0A8_9BACT|nr:glycosyltransferase [Pseudodesulfovibrio senegalensis]KAB1441289.1 glycosyltransferase family 4 protein [Pseudodesulfovibrio senegalensis]